ncbi:MAG TPA: bifunctional homocysteine S-methyltransferase/methylenetetrahydrofolate reductase [Dehalococcoidia bacterium]|nr:bifunctional homocysteine S-methyltransferase/methylenetetrahydrofolate reductase [Dehalococcoidia bacterium]
MASTTEPASDVAPAFLKAIETRVLLADGATGTVLHERGVPTDACLELANVERPELVRQLHLDYINAGADIIQTNTFGANRVRLQAFGLQDRVGELNAAGVRLAREAAASAGRRVFVAGDVGPLGEPLPDAEAREAFAEQMRALANAGVDLLLLQTFTSLSEATLAVRTAREVAPDLPVVAEISFGADFKTADGHSGQEAAVALRYAGADVVGANCGEGPAAVLRLVREMADVEGLRLVAQPSAGRPTLVQRRVVYQADAQYMADHARRYVEAGAVIVGGCCGTSPRHIGAMKRALEAPAPAVSVVAAPETKPAAAPGTLRQKLSAGKFVISVEIDPPKGLAVKRTVEAARLMKAAGADCVNVGDSPMAEVRMSAIAMGSILRQQAQVEVVVHCSPRDRNIMALQSDLMGAHALGIRNILCVKGDPHALGSYTNAAAVWDVNALGLMRILKGFNAGHDAIDKPVRPATNFFIGAAVNPSAEDVDAEVKLVRRKVNAGAEFMMSQAVFDPGTLERFLAKLGEPPIPIILGLWPIQSARQAAFLNDRIMPVPASLRGQIEKAGDSAGELGLELTARLLEKVRPMVQGVYFIPSFGRFQGIADLVALARRL